MKLQKGEKVKLMKRLDLRFNKKFIFVKKFYSADFSFFFRVVSLNCISRDFYNL